MGPVRLQLLGVCVTCAVCMLCFAQGEESIVQAKVGGAAELGCSLAPPSSGATAPPLIPLHVVEWVRRGLDVPVLIKFGPYAPRVHPSFERRVSLSRGAALLVERVRLEDEGWYECRILRLNRTTAGSVNGTWIFLSVSAPPEFTKTPPPVIEVMQGDSLALTCSAHGNPQPTIIWTKDGMDIGKGAEIEVKDGILTVRTVTRQMAGVYKCHVSNTEGNLSHATQLRVKGPPVILLPPKDTMLNISQNAQLQCRAEANPPNMTYVWWRHGENVYHIDSLKSRVKILVDGTLLIPNLIPEDSGNYTCMPTNGLLTPPKASAYLTVKHPAQAVQMPQVTYLPAGMGGRIACPVRAEPPLLSVSWTKDRQNLDLNMFPGWMLMADGSLFMAAANEDAVGTYTCTPYNSYGTMGSSAPTRVVLQDPPSFSVRPHEQYEQEVGTTLVIPCHAHGDPSPSITWAKVGRTPRSPYTVAANGSLVLEALSKDHHGPWECVAANQVANVTARTRVSVLGTSPHAVSSVTADPGTNHVNVSWVPGFDGGFSQKFTVWMKQTLGQKPDWVSLSAPPSAPPMLVTGLLPSTNYQFSVLPHNKVGTGPFSEIAAVQTLVPLTDPPPAVTMVPELAPPASLSVNQSVIGIVLKWVPPPPQGPPLTGFILQSRQEGEEEWNILKEDIGANDSETLLQGLQKDCRYELRMLSLRDGLVSTPSQPINISTAGMGAFVVRPRHLEGNPEVHVGGVLIGVGILCAVLLLLLGTACFLTRGKRRRRRQKRREDISSALQKCPPDRSGTRPDSPDSILKIKAGLLNTIFPKSSSSEEGNCREGPDQDRQLLCQPRPKSRLWGRGEGEGADVSPDGPLESIYRGPDGRFIVRPCQDSPTCSHKEDFPRGSVFSRWDCRNSLCSLCSDPDGMARVLSVDLPDTSQGSCSDSDSCPDPCGSTRRCTPLPADRAGTFPRWVGGEGRGGLLPQDRAWEMVDGGALVTQMEWERESGHLTRCLTLAREREALERELERCEARLSSRAWRSETVGETGPEKGQQAANPKGSDSTAHRDDPQLRGKDWPPPDPKGTCHSGAETAGPNVSAPSRTPRDSNPIISISGCIPVPHPDVWPQEGAGPYTTSSLPINPESTCLLSDSMKTGTCYWRASSQGSVSKPTKEPGSGKGKKDGDSFTQNATDQSQRHLLQGGDVEGGWDNEGHSPGSTWPYRRGAGADKTREVESLGITHSGSSTPSFPESVKEVARSHLWNSGKYLTIGRCGKSPVTNQMANDGSSSQPDVSVSQISGSVRPNLMPLPCEVSQVHTDPILEYLSLPGFVEMNVDEPMDENKTAAISSALNPSQRPGDVFPSELKALPMAWLADTREAGLTTQVGEPPAASLGLSSREESRHCLEESRAAGLCGRMVSSQKQLPSPDRTLRRQAKRSQSLPRESRPGRGEQGEPQNHLSDLTGRLDLHRARPRLGLSLVQDSDRPFTQAAQDPRAQGSGIHLSPSVCDSIPHTHDHGLHRSGQRPHKQGQGSHGCYQEPRGHGQGPHGPSQGPHGRGQGPHGQSQGLHRRGQGPQEHRKGPHGRGQANATNLTKTLIRRPCRTQVEVPPDPVLRKSASLRMQTREHRASAENPTSHASIGGGFPSPEVWVRSLSLGSASKCRSDPLRGTQHNSEDPPSRSSALTPSPPAPEQQRPLASPDPRRHATIFPEVPSSPFSYQEAPPLLQLNTAAPPSSTTPLYPSNSSSCASDHRQPPLPRWSQPSHSPLTRREPNEDQGVKQESETGQCVEVTSREEEGRGSFASQSSGRGSLGPLSGPTPSPTLPCSPETIQEIKAGRRRASVDENYEWDTTVVYLESDSPKPNQDMGLMKDFPCPEDSKGDPLSLSPRVLKYQLSSGSTSTRTCDLNTVLF